MNIELGTSDYITIIGIFVGIIGIVIGIIGLYNISYAKKIINKVTLENSSGNIINQAEVIYNGLESYAVIKLSRETTKEELCEIINRIDRMQKDIDEAPNVAVFGWKIVDSLINYRRV